MDALQVDPTQRGLLVLVIRVGPSGQVADVRVGSKEGLSESLAACAVDATRQAHFEAPGPVGATISVPFDLVAQGQGPSGTTATIPSRLQRQSADSPCADAPSRTKSAQTALERADASRDPKEKLQLALVSLDEYKLATSTLGREIASRRLDGGR